MREPSMNTELETQVKQQYENELTEIVKEGEKIEALKATPGWKLIEQDLYLRLESYGSTILNSKDPCEIYRLQGRMQEIKSILSFIDSGIQAKKDATEELETGEIK